MERDALLLRDAELCVGDKKQQQQRLSQCGDFSSGTWRLFTNLSSHSVHTHSPYFLFPLQAALRMLKNILLRAAFGLVFSFLARLAASH